MHFNYKDSTASVIFAALTVLLFSSGAYASSPTSSLPRLSVKGNSVYADGKAIKLRGVSLCSLEWQNPIKAINELMSPNSEWPINIIRLPVQKIEWERVGSEKYIKGYLNPVVQACKANGVYCIIDWHDIARWDDFKTNMSVLRFWNTIAHRYANEPNILYEIFNEPTHPSDISKENWKAWRLVAQKWVDSIRKRAPETVLLVGGPHWSQMPTYAEEEPFLGDNIIYTMHLYPIIPRKRWNELFGDASKKIPIFLSEFGWSLDEGSKKFGTYAQEKDFAIPLKNYLASHQEINWTAWAYDQKCGPAMLGKDSAMGKFIKSWLKNISSFERL